MHLYVAHAICHGLYVMCEGLPVTQRVCLSQAITAIMIHACHNDITIINVMEM